mgnify:CR=1 FL=1
MQGGESLLVPLVDLGPVVQQVVQHVQLLVGGGKVHGRAGPVVLRDEVRVGLHHLGELLGVTEADRAVEGDRRVLRDGRIPARLGGDVDAASGSSVGRSGGRVRG